MHGTDITLVGQDPSYLPITKFSIEQSDGVTSISEDLKKHTKEVFGIANEIRVITNFINCDLDTLKCGQKVKVCFVKSENGTALPMFEPA